MDRPAGAHGPGPPARDPHPPRHVKVRVTLPGRADRLEESLQALSTWTTDDLKRKIEGLAALRLGYQAVALLSHRGGRPPQMERCWHRSVSLTRQSTARLSRCHSSSVVNHRMGRLLEALLYASEGRAFWQLAVAHECHSAIALFLAGE
jgi:hypothetical protein